jgi:N-acetylmuramoyl-L-alanine amidase
MSRPPAREKETRDLIQRFQARRDRRRRMRLLTAWLGGAVVIALVAAVVVLATRGSGDQAGDLTTLASSGGVIASVPTSGAATGSGTSTTTGSTPTTEDSATTTTTQATTTSRPTTTTSASSTTSTVARSAGLVVVIDPGHQARADSSVEPIGPGSSETRAKVSSGTASVNSGAPESELVLAVALRLRDALVARGVEVIMTRTTEDVNIANSERARIANQAGADLFVRIHADGSDSSSTNGIHVLYPASIKGWTDDIAEASKKAAALAQRELIAATGAKDLGIDARSDLTGFNWSDVPVILPEIGFMSNAAEDRLLATAAYQDKIVAGLARAILAFLGVS